MLWLKHNDGKVDRAVRDAVQLRCAIDLNLTTPSFRRDRGPTMADRHSELGGSDGGIEADRRKGGHWNLDKA